MNAAIVDWRAIRPLMGSSARGFEELCAQLARAESPPGSHFERKGTPDAGVECYAILSDGKEWGWQAKYFEALGDSQWSQVDGSVRTALEKHPQLARYFVCVPVDRSDARSADQRSARQRWDDHVQKWAGWAAACGMTVEFIYWGSHELLERLAKPEHVGRVRFWFGVRRFDEAWFAAHLDDALKTAGPRYSPYMNVELPIAAELEAFGRTEEFFSQIKAHARDIRGKLRGSGFSPSKPPDADLEALSSAMSSKVQAVLAGLGSVQVEPIGDLPFPRIAEQVAAAEHAADDLERILLDRERQYDDERSAAAKGAEKPAYSANPFRESRFHLGELNSELRTTLQALEHANEVAGHSLMLLKGAAGTGKTHLLCDVTGQRIAAGRPTVLLMGQQFVGTEAPWRQALEHLDLEGLTIEEFVGALETAAQAAGARALVLVDAVNEGMGREIWPDHMAAFVGQLERSPWIGVLLSVRSSYEEIVVPKELRDRAVHVVHHGFAGHEYDAVRAFFSYYGLELPSTPLLAPEFGNPFYLKTLCVGLSETGQRRLPRGFQGITSASHLFFDAINKRLSERLGFDPRSALVRRAVEAFAGAMVTSGKRWLPLEGARQLVDRLLPGREYERSLYRGLVTEGVFAEEAGLRKEEAGEVVFVGYERLGDHLVAEVLLRDIGVQRVDPRRTGKPASRIVRRLGSWLRGNFTSRQWRALRNRRSYFPQGVLEALCIQVPERTGLELTKLCPGVKVRRGIGDAFRQSLVWRAPDAFSKDTVSTLNSLIRQESDLFDSLDVLLTVATLPEHPLNAQFLDQRLRRETMADRDSWWSIFLHNAWQSQGAVDRLVDWASNVTTANVLDDETVDLSAVALSWMLTTSNRFLRDRATKALVSLLTGRLGAVVRLVERFADVDDPYVAERVYAVAYGTAVRSNDAAEVGRLASCVYERVFAGGSPSAHILLRDCARGVVERAIFLGASFNVDMKLIRPPYTSKWPNIPTEDEIKPLLPDWSRGSHDSGELEWARNRIGSSVMEDDFARYVIGINSPFTNWLSLRLNEPPWQSHDERLAEVVGGFSEEERLAWSNLERAIDALNGLSIVRLRVVLPEVEGQEETEEEGVVDRGGEAPASGESAAAERGRDAALAALESVLTEDHAERLRAVLKMKTDAMNMRKRAPRFDLGIIQRYVLWRVFDLGWTAERFGKFDRYEIGFNGREASKAERLGKKYQWIAYHEIMAYVADHFQYREEFREEEGDKAYDGPWQERFRDIDPSCTLRNTAGGTSWDSHTPAWWGSSLYQSWESPEDPGQWTVKCDDLPRIESLLVGTNPSDGSDWLNVQGHLNWQQQTPPDRDSSDVERRSLWYSFTGYLVRRQDAQAFLDWAGHEDFWGRWMPDAPEIYGMFLGEHAWSHASHYFEQSYYGDSGWTQPGRSCPVKIRVATVEYVRESSGFDCSVDETYRLRLPARELVNGLGLRWSGHGADFVDAQGRVAAFDPTAFMKGPSAMLLRRDLLMDFLDREGYSICWAVLGEKRVLGPGFTPAYHTSVRLTGAYVLRGDVPDGSLKCILDQRDAASGSVSQQLLSVIRTPG